MKNLLITILLLGILSSCTKYTITEIPPYERPIVEYPLKMVWETYFWEDTTDVLTISEYKFYKDYVIFCGRDYPDYEYLHIFNRTTGEQLARIELGNNTIKLYELIDNYLIIPSLDNLKIFDLDQLKLVKTYDGDYSTNVTVFGNEAYVQLFHGIVPYVGASSLMKLSFPSMSMDEVFKITEEEYGGFAALNPVSLDINEVGDTMIYGTMATSPYYLYCYNKTKKDYEWKSDQSGKADKYFSKPLFDDKHVYITMHLGAEAYDKITGEQVWRTELEGIGGYRPCQPLLHDGYLYPIEVNSHLYKLNTTDGSIKWHVDEIYGAPDNYMVHHDGLLYYGGSQYLKIIDMATGRELFREVSPYVVRGKESEEEWRKAFANFTSLSPIIDSEKGLMYLSDSKRMFCFELPEL